MTVGIKTVQEMVDVIEVWMEECEVKPKEIKKLLLKLSEVKGNKSFSTSLQLLLEEFDFTQENK